MLSSRLPKDLSPSPFFAELERAKADVLAEYAEANSLQFIDMTVSSPVKAGLPVDLDDAVDEGRKAFGNWSPDAAGWKSAREAVVEYYRQRGGNFTAGQIILTASTSEAYSVLFKTFCDPGDVIMTPMPGYPLLDTLAQLEHLECAPYFLKLKRERFDKLTDLKKVTERRSAPAEVNAFRFVLDSDSLLAAPERAKILLLVSPHNPTGHCVSREEWNEAVRFCEENNMILVVDEVFGDYAFSDKVSRTWQFVFDSCHPERNEVESKDLKPDFVVISKSDLLDERRETKDERGESIRISSKTGEGLAELRQVMNAALFKKTENSEDLWITSEREKTCLEEALAGIDRALSLIRTNPAVELLAFEMQLVRRSLQSITGEISSEDVLQKIFAGFCIGK